MIPRLSAVVLVLISLPIRAQVDDLLVEDAWIRAMPPSATMSAAYLELVNTGTRPLTITGVSAEGVAEASLHETRREGDSIRMQAVAALTVAPGARLELAPGGRHIMLMGLERGLADGDVLRLCLETDAGEHCAAVPVISMREPMP